MAAPQTTRDDMIDGQILFALATILAGVIIAPENLALIELYTRTGSFYHHTQADNGWTREGARDRLNNAAPIHYQTGFSSQDKDNCALRRTYIDGRKIGIQYQYRLVQILHFLWLSAVDYRLGWSTRQNYSTGLPIFLPGKQPADKIAFVMNLPTKSGSYALFLKLPSQQELTIGRLGTCRFPAGIYVYFGSARGPGGLQARLRRHLRTGKKHHWHIDAMRAVAEVHGFCYHIEQKNLQHGTPAECQWSQSLLTLPGVQAPLPGFGASDCKMGCQAHLLHLKNTQQVNTSDFCETLASALEVPPETIICKVII